MVCMGRILVTLDRLKALLQYEPETGVWTWLVARSNRHPAGAIAGTTQSNGYIYIGIEGKLYLSHRLAWFYMTGKWPANAIDHINRNRADNRRLNLREATMAQNLANTLKHKDNVSGYKGVCWHTAAKKWHAQICVNMQHINLGLYTSKEEAYAAYVAAANNFHGEFANYG